MNNQNTLIQSEQSVIGSLLVDNNSFDEIGSLKTSDFFREDHRIIFNEISSMLGNGKPVDLILLAESLDAKKLLDKVGGLKYIGAIVQSVTTTKNIKFYAKNIEADSKRRKLKALIVDLSEYAESKLPIEELTEKAETGLFNLLESEKNNVSHIGDAVAEAIDWADSDHAGVKTGLRDLDRLTNGFNKSNLIIIAGRPSMGKSALSMQIAEHVAKQESVIIFSLEMSKREVGARLVKYHESRVGQSQAVKHLYDLKLHIDDSSAITLSHIRSQCRKIKRQHGLSMIVVDYLQLMRGTGDNRTQEVGFLSRGLKAIAKDFDIPVVVLSQLNRSLEQRADKRPVMSDLRESGEIEQDADLILFIYRDEVYNQLSDYKGIAEIICRKNRNGATGEVTASWTGEVTRFGDYNGQSILRVIPKKRERGFTVDNW